MSPLYLARGIALLHPAALTVVGLLSGVVPVTSSLPGARLVLVSLVCGWAWGIYVISTAKTAQDGVPRWTPWIFLCPPTVAAIAQIANLPTSNNAMGLFIIGTLLLGFWRAAQALEYADPRGKPVTVTRIVGTTLLIFFSLVGFWWLHHRIVRVAGEPAA